MRVDGVLPVLLLSLLLLPAEASASSGAFALHSSWCRPNAAHPTAVTARIRHSKKKNSPQQSIRLFMAENNKDDTGTAQKNAAKVRFSSTETADTNPVDATLSWITSDIGSIILGGVGLVLLLVGRLILDGTSITGSSSSASYDAATAAANMGAQARVNLLAVFAVGSVLLNGLSQLDVQSVLAEQVDLQGSLVAEPVLLLHSKDDLPANERQLSWALSSIAAASPAATAVLLLRSRDDERWKPVAYTGVVPPNLLLSDPLLPEQTPILDRFLIKQQQLIPSTTTTNANVVGAVEKRREETYLPTLQALPGRTEFTSYLLPPNTQAALLLPLMLKGVASSSGQQQQQQAVLLLGSNQARSFTPRDIAWSQTVATRLEDSIAV